MSNEQKTKVVVNPKQKSYGIDEALSQVPESTSNALNVRKPSDTGSPKETQAERTRKAGQPGYSTYEPGGYSGPN